MVDDIVRLLFVGDFGFFVSVGSFVWWTVISVVIMVLRWVGVRLVGFVLFGLVGVMTFYVMFGALVFVCLSVVVYVIECCWVLV